MGFSPGDIVQLKSGGPPMTVTSGGPEGVHCVWFGEASDDLKTGVVPAACLDNLILDGDDLADAGAAPSPDSH